MRFVNDIVAELDKLLATNYPIWAYRAEYLSDSRHDRLAPGRADRLRWRDVDLSARRVRVVSPSSAASSTTRSPRAPDARSLSPTR